MTYKLFKSLTTGEITSVSRFNDDNSITSIPMVEANTDYQAYLKFLENGGTPLPADE